MAAAGLLPASGGRVCQRNGISVYSRLSLPRHRPDDVTYRACCLFITTDPLKSPPLKDKIATLNSQEPYTVALFSLWLCVSIAADELRQYNENYYHSI
ncbi:hypothetical protein CU079_11505 [Citrobacter freundii]|nr:hypothetical protein CU079_11505 [Citrobacter freundii]